ncbi:hypothetical protein CVT24_011419 [Panaeolus cyanescens]|uniref:Uncharacterized protein n=1 Tax=Panaeolus cyanescens TaxID=181874 RepID=A0A409VG84_9AGAR|nr:hypothetical protein CVT24_011419 [Panaeolus cyanescens]
MAQLTIPASSTALEPCKPNLMPFHIDYNGPAPVSQFMRVEKLRREPASQSAGAATSTDNTASQNTSGDGDATMTDVEAVSGTGAPERPSLTAASSVATLCDSTSTSTPASELSEATLVPTPSVESSVQPDTAASQTQLDDIPILDEMDRRVQSAFRGRDIHGLEIDLPKGYSGLVLLPDPNTQEQQASTSKNAKASAKKAPKPREPTPEAPAPSRRRGRLTRSAAPSKQVVEVDDAEEDAVVDLTQDDGQKDVPRREELAQRNLTPISTFSSFTLWQPDRPVDKERDEYYRTLNEWIGLAHVIHGVDV